MKRIIALLVLMSVLVLSFASCGGGKDPESGNDIQPGPEGQSNFPWEKTTLVFEISENSDSTQLPSSSRRYLAGDLTGNETDHKRVDDYVETRNKEAEAYTNVQVKYEYLADVSQFGWGQNIQTIYGKATGGNPNAPDVFINFVYDMVAASLKGAFANLYSTTMYEDGHALAGTEHNYFAFEDDRKYVDTGKDYMYEYMRSLTLSNTKMYCLSSDYFVDMVRAFFVVPVNIELIEMINPTTELGQYNTDRNGNGKYDIDDFYRLVWDMEWNYETLAGFANDITAEQVGEGITLEDRVGFALGTSSGIPASGMLYTTSITIVKKSFDNTDYTYWYPKMQQNPDGSFRFNENYIGPDGRYDTTFEQLDTFCRNLSALVDNDGVITVSTTDAAALGYTNGEAEAIRKRFASNNMLFGGVIVLGALEHDDYLAMKGEGRKGYGIAPIPLYHTDLAEDETYLTQIHNNGKIGAISYGTHKFAQCTAYLNYQSTHSNNVLEEYYNHKLKATVQVVDAAGNIEMLTYIREHVRSSFDKAFEDALGEHYSQQTGGASEANKWHTMIKEANFQLTNMRAQYAEIARVKAANLYDLENYGYYRLPS